MIYPRNPAADQARRNRRLLLAAFGTPIGQKALEHLEQRFETHLPVFQGKPGCYDPLDAMRRDAHREVFLVIRSQLELARVEAKQELEQDNEHQQEQ